MTPTEFETTLRAVLEDYNECLSAGLGIDYEEMAHSFATRGTAPVPTVSSNLTRRLCGRRWLDQAQALLEAAIDSPRQRLEYVQLVVEGGAPRTQRELVLMRLGRTAVAQAILKRGTPCWLS